MDGNSLKIKLSACVLVCFLCGPVHAGFWNYVGSGLSKTFLTGPWYVTGASTGALIGATLGSNLSLLPQKQLPPRRPVVDRVIDRWNNAVGWSWHLQRIWYAARARLHFDECGFNCAQARANLEVQRKQLPENNSRQDAESLMQAKLEAQAKYNRHLCGLSNRAGFGKTLLVCAAETTKEMATELLYEGAVEALHQSGASDKLCAVYKRVTDRLGRPSPLVERLACGAVAGLARASIRKALDTIDLTMSPEQRKRQGFACFTLRFGD